MTVKNPYFFWLHNKEKLEKITIFDFLTIILNKNYSGFVRNKNNKADIELLDNLQKIALYLLYC